MSIRSRLNIPAVRIPVQIEIIDDKELRWSEFREVEQAEKRRLTDKALLAFARLGDATPREIAEFAARYGVLRVNELTTRGNELIRFSDTDIQLPDRTIWRPVRLYYRIFPRGATSGAEPLALWRFLAAKLRAILRINAALKGRARRPHPEVGAEVDWEILTEAEPPEDATIAKVYLAWEVGWWLRLGGVGLDLGVTEYSRSRCDWKIEIAYVGLLGALAYQLLLNVAGEGSLYACDGCGTPYIRLKRAPRPGQENFCDDCSDVAKKRAVQRYRQRKAQQDEETRTE